MDPFCVWMDTVDVPRIELAITTHCPSVASNTVPLPQIPDELVVARAPENPRNNKNNGVTAIANFFGEVPYPGMIESTSFSKMKSQLVSTMTTNARSINQYRHD